MKKINILVSAFVISLLAAGCAKESLSKSEVEAGFPNAYKGKIPEISFEATPSGEAQFDIASGAVYVEASVTVSGITKEVGEVEIGVITSTTDDFKNTKVAGVPVTEDGTYTVRALVNANTTSYFQASISTKYGSSYSDVVTAKVSDVPFYGKIVGKWAGTMISLAYGDEYEGHTIEIILDETDYEKSCYIYDIEPYYAAEGYNHTEGFNIVKGIIDSENNQILIPTGSDMTLGGRQYYATNSSMDEVYDYGAFVLSEDGASLKCDTYFENLKPNGQPEDLYAPVEFSKL